jgi:hypothetical protein
MAMARRKRKATPVSKAAEAVVCHRLGIINDGQIVTDEKALKDSPGHPGNVCHRHAGLARSSLRSRKPLIQLGSAAALDNNAELQGADVWSTASAQS